MGSVTLPVALERAETRVAEVLPPTMDPTRVMRLARMAIHKNAAIMRCDPVSVVEAIIQASRLGLEIDSPIGGAHLVPFKTKCQMIVDYRALIRLALDHPDVLKVVARPVYKDEQFRVVQGTTDAIIHEPTIDGPKSDGDIVGFYAVAKLTGGESVHEYASKEEVDKVRARSRASAKGPWVTDYAAMGQKTMVKRLIKWLPLSKAFAEAVEADNRGEGFSAGSMESDTVGSAMAAKALETQEDLRRRLGAGDAEETEAAPEPAS